MRNSNIKFCRPKNKIKGSDSYRKHGVLRSEAAGKKRKIKPWIYAGILTVIALSVLIASRKSRGFAEFFSLNIYPYFSGAFARIFGWIPFSVGEIVLYAFVLTVLSGIVYHVVKIVRSPGKRAAVFTDMLRRGAAIAATVFFLATMNCFAGYNRYPFSSYTGFTLSKYTREELISLTEEIVKQANYYSGRIKTDEENTAVCDTDVQSEAVAAMKALGKKYEVLDAYYPLPKPVLCSKLMSYCDITGMYFPFTVEANYNNDITESTIPFTVCHELSHLTGFIREDEANYIAFMACRESSSDFFRYSGYVDALVYCLNACYPAVSAEEYSVLYGNICPQIQAELTARNRYWEQFKTPVAEAASKINDTYLKVNNQQDGTKSYGRIVDLMIAEFLANGTI